MLNLTFKDKRTPKYYWEKIIFGKKKAKENLRISARKKVIDTVKKHFSDRKRIMLNLGCGDVCMKDWINIDLNENYPALDILYDLRNPLPFEDGTVDFIFNEHFLEHLTPEDGVALLQECRRVLKKGGVLRVAMPHIKPVVDRYFNDKWYEEPWLKEFHMDFIKTKAEVVNIGFHAWGHKWLYDEEELERRLKEAGFTDFHPAKRGVSSYPELQNLETRAGSDLIYEAVKREDQV